MSNATKVILLSVVGALVAALVVWGYLSNTARMDNPTTAGIRATTAADWAKVQFDMAKDKLVAEYKGRLALEERKYKLEMERIRLAYLKAVPPVDAKPAASPTGSKAVEK